MSLLQNKVCIITGAGSGIGATAAELFSREGASLALVGRSREKLEQTKTAIEGVGGRAICIIGDVRNSEDCDSMVRQTIDAFGRLDCALNNAAVDGVQALTADYPEDVWREVIDINLNGTWNCMKFQIRAMLKQGGGSIVNVSSASTEPTQPLMAAYVASKYAVNGLTKCAAHEYAGANIRINALLPGVTDTPMISQLMKRHPEMEEASLRRLPSGRLGSTTEIARAAAWLLSDQNSYMFGSLVVVDGGLSFPYTNF